MAWEQFCFAQMTCPVSPANPTWSDKGDQEWFSFVKFQQNCFCVHESLQLLWMAEIQTTTYDA